MLYCCLWVGLREVRAPSAITVWPTPWTDEGRDSESRRQRLESFRPNEGLPGFDERTKGRVASHELALKQPWDAPYSSRYPFCEPTSRCSTIIKLSGRHGPRRSCGACQKSHSLAECTPRCFHQAILFLALCAAVQAPQSQHNRSALLIVRTTCSWPHLGVKQIPRLPPVTWRFYSCEILEHF